MLYTRLVRWVRVAVVYMTRCMSEGAEASAAVGCELLLLLVAAAAGGRGGGRSRT
jgi:hypothetical protein